MHMSELLRSGLPPCFLCQFRVMHTVAPPRFQLSFQLEQSQPLSLNCCLSFFTEEKGIGQGTSLHRVISHLSSENVKVVPRRVPFSQKVFPFQNATLVLGTESLAWISGIGTHADSLFTSELYLQNSRVSCFGGSRACATRTDNSPCFSVLGSRGLGEAHRGPLGLGWHHWTLTDVDVCHRDAGSDIWLQLSAAASMCCGWGEGEGEWPN